MSGFLQESSPVPGRRHDLSHGITIGRQTDADIVLIDPKASRLHARVLIEGDGVAIEDLGSSNGTHVNEERITGTVTLKEGDTVRIGETVWRFFRGQRAESRGDVPAPDPMTPSAMRARPAASPEKPARFQEPETPPAARAARRRE